MKFTVGKKITIRVTDYIIKNVKISSGAVRKLIEFHDKTGNTYVWGVTYSTQFPEDGVKYVSAKILKIKDTEEGQIIVLTGAKDITAEKEEQLARRRAKAVNKGTNKSKEPKEPKEKELPPTVGGDVAVDNAPPAEQVSQETVTDKDDLNSAEKEAVGVSTSNDKETDITPNTQEAQDKKDTHTGESLGWQAFGISDKKYIRLTEPYIRKMFDTFNDAYFEGKLTLIGVGEIWPGGGGRKDAKIVPNGATRHAAGYVQTLTYDRHTNWGLGPTEVAPREDHMLDSIVEFCIGEKRNQPKRTEKSWCEIILHEMIHVYQHLILRRTTLEIRNETSDRTGHGPSFTVKMKEINEKGGWDISVTDDKIGGTQISEGEAKDLQENYYLISFDSKKDRISGEKQSTLTLVPKDKVKDLVSYFVLYHKNVMVYEVHNAESISAVPKSDESNKIFIDTNIARLAAIVQRGDVTKLDTNNFIIPHDSESDEMAKKYYLAVGHDLRGKITIRLLPKEELRTNKESYPGSIFFILDKVYTIINSEPIKNMRVGATYGLTKKNFNSLKNFLGEEIKMTENVNIEDLKPEIKQIYESIFYESNLGEDIFEDYVDEDSKIVEIGGQKVLYSIMP